MTAEQAKAIARLLCAVVDYHQIRKDVSEGRLEPMGSSGMLEAMQAQELIVADALMKIDSL